MGSSLRPKAALSSSSLLLLVEKIPAVLWTTDRELRVTSAAGAGLAAINVRSEDYLGTSLVDLSARLGADPTILAAHRRALRGKGSPFDIEIRGRDLQAHVEPLRGPEGRIVGVIGVALENTERRVERRALSTQGATVRCK